MRISKDIFNLRFYNKDMSLTNIGKIILSSFEDKRYYVDGLNSYGYGHHKIKENSSNKGSQSPPRGEREKKKNPRRNRGYTSKEKEIR